MTLSETWAAYHEGEYSTSLQLSAQGLADNAGIDQLHIAGLSLIHLKRFEEGLALLNGAITLLPQSPHIYSNAAMLCEEHGMTKESAYFADAGLRNFPDEPNLLLVKANSLVMQLQFDEAVPYYLELLKYDATNVQAMINLGNISRANDAFEDADRWFQRAETLDPDFRDLVFARATMYTQMGDDDKAIQILETIAADVDAQFLLALLYLARGDYERGFRLYRWRGYAVWTKAGRTIPPEKLFDHWLETTDKSVAVVTEGGLGDLLQFVRYIPLLAQVARSITLFIPHHLARLFRQLPDNVTITITNGYDTTLFDYVTTLIDMPYHFRTTIETIPDTIPYLTVPPAMIAQRRLDPTDRKRVGLCWAGGEREDLNARSYDTRRSFDLATYAPLGKVPGIEFVSLQLGQRAAQRRVDLPLTTVLDPSFDMLDTAAIIAQLDLVISVDTAVAHLAAAMGKPVWLLSRYDSCWRWAKNVNPSPWYPKVLRVFGQKRYNDWSDPIRELRNALEEWVWY